MNCDNPYRATVVPSQFNMSTTSHIDPAWYFCWLRVSAFVVAMIGGACVWSLSPRLVGEAEPWDSTSGYYWIGITTASAVGGMLAGRQMWLPILGTYLGQVVYCVLFYHPGGPIIIPIVISAGLFGMIPSVVGAGIGAIPHELCRAAFRTPTDVVAEPSDEREPD
jgi:hypothetical protein